MDSPLLFDPDLCLKERGLRGRSMNRKKAEGPVVAPLPQRDSFHAKRHSFGGTFFESALWVWRSPRGQWGHVLAQPVSPQVRMSEATKHKWRCSTFFPSPPPQIL